MNPLPVDHGTACGRGAIDFITLCLNLPHPDQSKVRDGLIIQRAPEEIANGNHRLETYAYIILICMRYRRESFGDKNGRESEIEAQILFCR